MDESVGIVTTVVVIGENELEVLGTRALIAQDPRIELLEHGNGAEAHGLFMEAANVVVHVTDAQQGNHSEVADNCKSLLKALPDAHIVALIDKDSLTQTLLQEGVRSIVLKSTVVADLHDAIFSAASGEPFLSRPLLDSAIAPVQVGGYQSELPIVINKTKLHRPPPPQDVVDRHRLIEILNTNRDLPLILIAAPAGFGKSLLVSSWLENLKHPSVWLSLESDESDLRRFLAYLLGAVRGIDSETGQCCAALLSAVQLPGVSTIASALREDFDQMDLPFYLVLDDYHTLSASSPVHELLDELLAHPPIVLHIIITARRDPPLSLVTLRGKGQIAELRVRDLAFDDAEARMLIERISGKSIDRETLLKLERALEGWPVGIRLTGLAIRQEEHIDKSLEVVGLATRQATEFLTAEVVGKLPEPLHTWLCRTSILKRLCPSLCDELCVSLMDGASGGFDGREFLKQLQEEGLFVIPLDIEGKWFRYHPVFQDALRRRLDVMLDEVDLVGISLRACQWFEVHGEIESAIDQALEFGGDSVAVAIVERHHRNELDLERWHTVEQWLGMLPLSALSSSPELLVAYGWVAANARDGQALHWVVEAFDALNLKLPDERLSRDLSCFRSYLCYAQGDISQALGYLAGFRSSLPAQATATDGLIATLHGVLLTMSGSLQEAVAQLNQFSRTSTADEGFRSQSIIGLMIVHSFDADYRQTISESHRLSIGRLELQARKANLLGCSLFEAGDLPAAETQLIFAIKYRYLLPALPAYETMAALALTQQIQGKTTQAASTADDLDAFTLEKDSAQGQRIAASCRARLALINGELSLAESWLEGSDVAIDAGEFLVSTEVPAFTLVRVLTARGSAGDLSRAESVLSTIGSIVDALHLTCHKIEVLALLSSVRLQRGQTAGASEALIEALKLSSGGTVRPFLELPEATANLLRQLSGKSESGASIEQIMAARRHYTLEVDPRRSQADELPLVALTNREMEILELLSQRLQNKEIASRLFVSAETVKTHLKHLYSKIGVGNRRQAAAVATQFLNS